MKATTIEKRVTGLQEELDDLRRQLAEVQSQLLDTFNREKIAELRARERDLEDQIATVEATIAAGDRARVEAQAKEAEAARLKWQGLREQAAGELDEAHATVMGRLRELAEAYTAFVQVRAAWEAQRQELGGPDPQLPRIPNSLEDFLFRPQHPLRRPTAEERELRELLRSPKGHSRELAALVGARAD